MKLATIFANAISAQAKESDLVEMNNVIDEMFSDSTWTDHMLCANNVRVTGHANSAWIVFNDQSVFLVIGKPLVYHDDDQVEHEVASMVIEDMTPETAKEVANDCKAMNMQASLEAVMRNMLKIFQLAGEHTDVRLDS